MTNKKPKVLLLTHFYPAHRGGIEIVAEQLASRLAKHYNITWLAADCDPCPNIQDITPKPQKAWNTLEEMGFPWPIWQPRCWRALLHSIKECDLVHIHDYIYPANLVAIWQASRQNKPVVVTQHIGDIEYPNIIARNLLKVLNRVIGRWMFGKASQVIFISQRVKHSFEAYCNFETLPLLWPNGVDTRIFYPADREERCMLRLTNGLSLSKPVILFVGRFVERKGLHLLRELVASQPEWQWCFAGKGQLDPSSWNLPNVHVWSNLQKETLAPLYQFADLLVLPSYGEGFPLVLQESLACGTPVLVSEETAAGGPKIPDCIMSVEYSPHSPNPTRWTTAIEKYLRRSNKDEIRCRCTQNAQLLWNWDEIANNYRNLFATLSEHSPE